jgi:lysophospholipase L1-like esterase
MTSAFFRCMGRVLLAVLVVATVLALAGRWATLRTGMHEAPVHSRPSPDRCQDDDPIISRKPCHCPDPTRASYAFRTIGEERTAWLARHDVYCSDLQQVAREKDDLDVILLGDSILERWNGTRHLGRDDLSPEYRASWASFFDRRMHDAPLSGLVLGTAGDVTTELLWHLQNGIVTDTPEGRRTTVAPKVWFVLIGTNDLGRMECSKRTTLAGILQVLQFIQTHRPPQELLLVHGLLPRADTYQQQNYTLGRYWQDILWINQELRRFCDLHDHWYYMEAPDLFLTNATTGDLMIDARTMSDSLHPDLEGYQLWGARIVDTIQQLLAPPDE